MLSEILTFLIFILIGLELRQGLKSPRETVLPSLCALAGMVTPACIFIVMNPASSAWAVVMPTDVALAIGALSLLGSKVNPAVRLFLLTLAVADDFFSLVVIGIFFRNDLHLSSAIYTLGAAVIGLLLPGGETVIKWIAPVVTFAVIPLYVLLNLFLDLDLSATDGSISIGVITARVLGKVAGITIAAWALTKFTSLKLPERLDLKEVAGVGFLAGMGLTVSLVIADITLTAQSEIAQVKAGLFIAALLSGLFGLLWLKRFPASL